MMRYVFLVASLAILVCGAVPLRAQTDAPPPPPDEEHVGPQDLPPKVCPADWRDGPLYADGRTYYGIPAKRIVEGFLAPPHDSFGRVHSRTQAVSVSDLRMLADGTDYDACLRLTTALTNGERSAPPLRTWVYFTAGGFYFVSQWKPAQALSDYTTSYGHVLVFDSGFNLVGTYTA